MKRGMSTPKRRNRHLHLQFPSPSPPSSPRPLRVMSPLPPPSSNPFPPPSTDPPPPTTPPPDDEEEMDRVLEKVIEAVIHQKRQPLVQKRREESRKVKPDDEIGKDLEKLFTPDPSMESRLEKLDKFFGEKPPDEIATLVQHFSHLSINDSDALILSPPLDKPKFQQVLRNQRQAFRKDKHFKDGEEDGEPYQIHYFNHITSVQSVIDSIQETYQAEKRRGSFKIAADFGIIWQKNAEEDQYSYTFSPPALKNVKEKKMSFPTLVSNPGDVK